MLSIADARAALIPRRRLDRDGCSSREISAAIAEDRLFRVRRGWYVEKKTWDAVYAEGRQLLRVVASHEERSDGGGVYSHVSAAVAHGLWLFRAEPARVHLSGATLNGQTLRSGPLVARHEVPVPEADTEVIDGIPCTSLARTVADVIRQVPIVVGLALADAAMRRVAWDDESRTYDEAGAEAFRAQVGVRLPVGGRGVRRARRVIELADGRAQLPGESASRLYLLELGFASPRLQVAVPAPNGGSYFVDFGLDDVDAWGEFDGVVKYTDAQLRGAGVDIEGAVLAEKQREDWIRGTTQRRLARWGTPHIANAAALGARLASFHIFAP